MSANECKIPLECLFANIIEQLSDLMDVSESHNGLPVHERMEIMRIYANSCITALYENVGRVKKIDKLDE